MPRAPAGGGGGGRTAGALRRAEAAFSWATTPPATRALARELGLAEPAVRVAVHRLRKRFGGVLREEVLRTVTDPADVDSEIRWLLTAVRGDGAGRP